MKRDLYAEVSARIIAELEAGAAPWVKPWSATPGANTPCNAATNRPYSGCNVVLLWIAQQAGYRMPRYLTFKQALELGGNVRKGERGTKVYFVKQLQVRDERNEEEEANRIVPMMREYTVFNVDQCDGLPDRVFTRGEIKRRNLEERDATIDDFLTCSGATIRGGSGEAYYRPGDDFISLPPFEAFKSAAHFYGVAFHELGHWTGHKSRLDRDLRFRFGERAYAAEELVAELCAAFLCAEFSIDGDLRHAGYIASWIGLLKADNRAFFTACSKAQAAADYPARSGAARSGNGRVTEASMLDRSSTVAALAEITLRAGTCTMRLPERATRSVGMITRGLCPIARLFGLWWRGRS
jgi:antirestriction protein ArdC